MRRDYFFYVKTNDDAVVLTDRIIARGLNVDRHVVAPLSDPHPIQVLAHGPVGHVGEINSTEEQAFIAEMVEGLDAICDGTGTAFA